MPKITFDELLQQLEENKPIAEDLEIEGQSNGSLNLSLDQAKKFALAIANYTHPDVPVIRYGLNYCPNPQLSDDFQPYKRLLANRVIRNMNLDELKYQFQNYILRFVFPTLFIFAHLGGELLSFTIGLRPLMILLSNINFGYYNVSLPSIDIDLNDPFDAPCKGYYDYEGGMLSLPFVPTHYFFRSLGKIIGAIISLPFVVVINIFTIGVFIAQRVILKNEIKESEKEIQRSVDEVIITEANKINSDTIGTAYKLCNSLIKQFPHKQNYILEKFKESLENLVSRCNEAYFVLGEILRDQQEFSMAYNAFIRVNSASENYKGALYEAGHIALHNLNRPVDAKKYFEEARRIAAIKKDEELENDVAEILKNINILLNAYNTSQSQSQVKVLNPSMEALFSRKPDDNIVVQDPSHANKVEIANGEESSGRLNKVDASSMHKANKAEIPESEENSTIYNFGCSRFS